MRLRHFECMLRILWFCMVVESYCKERSELGMTITSEVASFIPPRVSHCRMSTHSNQSLSMNINTLPHHDDHKKRSGFETWIQWTVCHVETKDVFTGVVLQQVKQSSDNRCELPTSPTYLSLNCLLNGIFSHSWCYFVQIWPMSQKFNSCVTDGLTDGPTDGHTLL